MMDVCSEITERRSFSYRCYVDVKGDMRSIINREWGTGGGGAGGSHALYEIIITTLASVGYGEPIMTQGFQSIRSAGAL
jgi:hypothetical protein